ncbi:uncharacterized protein TNCV_2474361 [Trichonephila clavipes]|nr:uncharacterized protein TNCV_2474361 [Trichonephila clavipes]
MIRVMLPLKTRRVENLLHCFCRKASAPSRSFPIRAKNQVNTYTEGSSDSDLDKCGAGIYLIPPHGGPESYRVPTSKISSNFTCELMTRKEVLDNYYSRAMESSSGILLFLDSRSTFHAILRGNFQLKQYIIALIKRVVSAQKNLHFAM